MAPQNLPFTGPTTTNDLGIYEANPGIQFGGTEPGAVYFEDREIAGALYRVQNATWNGVAQKWVLVNPTLPAYGFMLQNGAFSLLSSPANVTPFTAWATSTVFSTFQRAAVPNVLADGSAHQTITFPTPFVGTPPTVIVPTIDASGAPATYNLTIQYDTITLTGFNVFISGGPPGFTVTVRYYVVP